MPEPDGDGARNASVARTRVSELLSWMVSRPKPLSDATGGTILRRIDRDQPTLLVDEAQHFLKTPTGRSGSRHSEILLCRPMRWRGQFPTQLFDLRAQGNERSQARRCRRHADVALRGHPDDAGEKALSGPAGRPRPVGEDICRMCARWRDDHLANLRNADPDMDGMFGRIAQVWRPLLAVADAAGGDWPRLARHAASSLANQTNAIASGDTLGVQLLRDIRQVFQDHSDPDRLSTADLDHALNAMPERPWATLSNGKPMTSQKRGRMLSDYGIHTTKVRDGEKTRNVYLNSAFEPAWEAWLQDAHVSEPEHWNNNP